MTQSKLPPASEIGPVARAIEEVKALEWGVRIVGWLVVALAPVLLAAGLAAAAAGWWYGWYWTGGIAAVVIVGTGAGLFAARTTWTDYVYFVAKLEILSRLHASWYRPLDLAERLRLFRWREAYKSHRAAGRGKLAAEHYATVAHDYVPGRYALLADPCEWLFRDRRVDPDMAIFVSVVEILRTLTADPADEADAGN